MNVIDQCCCGKDQCGLKYRYTTYTIQYSDNTGTTLMVATVDFIFCCKKIRIFKKYAILVKIMKDLLTEGVSNLLSPRASNILL